MDNKKYYLISIDDYLSHIDAQLKMYDLLITGVWDARELLLDGEIEALYRSLAKFEHRAHELFESWKIGNNYVPGETPEPLRPLMEKELTEPDNAGCCPEGERCCDFAEQLERGLAGGQDADPDIEAEDADSTLTLRCRLLKCVNDLNDICFAMCGITREDAEMLDADGPDPEAECGA